MNNRRSIPIYKTVFILMPMVISLALAMDIYVPALPRIASLFHITTGTMQLTLTLFMFAASIMQLIVGPLSDQFGRKPISLIMIAIFALGTFLCATAETVGQLIFYRIIQAIGSCGMLVLAFAIVRDLYHGKESGQAYSYLNGLIAFSPMFAPFIGSFLDIHFGWPSTFLSLLLVALLGFIFIGFLMSETLLPKNRIKMSTKTFHEYKTIFMHPIFLIYTIATAMGMSYLYLFCSISPYIIIQQLHIPEAYYGFYFCFMGISFFIGSFLSGFTVSKIGIYRTVILGFWITLLGGIVMTGWYFITGLTIYNFIWPMLLIGIGGTFSMGAGTGGSMEPFGETAGAASALGGAMRFIFSTVIGAIVIRNNVSSTLPLSIPAILFSITGLITLVIFRNTLAQDNNSKDAIN